MSHETSPTTTSDNTKYRTSIVSTSRKIDGIRDAKPKVIAPGRGQVSQVRMHLNCQRERSAWKWAVQCNSPHLDAQSLHRRHEILRGWNYLIRAIVTNSRGQNLQE